MRFTDSGPSIPDALLNARDEGRVVFFCGAGISKAQAGLPDFFGLVERVVRELGALEDSDACKLLRRARQISEAEKVTGLISADRVFGLLERDFEVRDIQAAVARTLNPSADVNLSAHQLILRLATTPDSRMQLVTTNFDRLFEKCGVELEVHQPPRLPNPSRYNDLNGVVYLHGRVNDGYTGPDRHDLVLSSSDFGYAYLAEGWATEFFREIIREYVVVFVGYSADDPPIHYLLEGLGRKIDSSREIYAFQPDDSDEAIARWRDKRVTSIPYAPGSEHQSLWKTLELWAERADDPTTWCKLVVDSAMQGPRKLEPYQRGQVAHLVATPDGARVFAESSPPAEWLCVFDPECRYAGLHLSKTEDPIVPPFAVYRLDSDVVPESRAPDRPSVSPKIASRALDIFLANDLDRQNLSEVNVAAVRGDYATRVPRLPERLEQLGAWIANVANQPTAVWWGARQKSLHAGIRGHIEWSLNRIHADADDAIMKAWRYLLEGWERADGDARHDRYDLEREIKRDGWSLAAVRRFTAISSPFVEVGPASLPSDSLPAILEGPFRLEDLVRLDVNIPLPEDNLEIPDEWLGAVVRSLRKNVVLAVGLCEEVNDMNRFHISPIVQDKRPDIGDYGRVHGLSGLVIWFASLFERLIELDDSIARQEFAAWPTDEDTAFSRLRLWAGGKQTIATPHGFCQIVNRLSDRAFWSSDHQRDLLLVLVDRWKDLSERDRKRIEHRLLEGPARWEGENESEYAEYRTRAILERLQWLAEKGCEFSFDVAAEIARWQVSAPNWKPHYATRAADSRETRGGWVQTNTQYSALLHEPIESILSKAHELSGSAGTNMLEERDPFGGLCAERPVRAYRALMHAARRDRFPSWAWNKFLTSSAREDDPPKFSAAIASRLCRFPDAALQELLYISTGWLQTCGKTLSGQYPNVFDKFVTRFVGVVYLDPSKARSAVVDVGQWRDWVTAALNSPVGHLTMAILEDSRLEGMNADASTSAVWLTNLRKLLALTGDPRRHAIAIMSHHLAWFHQLVPEWTERHLLSIIDDDTADRAALWAGFFWNPQLTSVVFYYRLKPALLSLAKQRDPSREAYVQSLAGLILSGWTRTEDDTRLVSGDEFRDVLLHGGDGFRSHILWQLKRVFANDDRDRWVAQAQELFRDVWPRQRSVKNPTMSIRLVELLLSSKDVFPELAEIVMPLLTTIDGKPTLHFRSDVHEIIDNYPELFLRLLEILLPEDVTSWPYGIADVLERLGESDAASLSDTRLERLKRKWNAR